MIDLCVSVTRELEQTLLTVSGELDITTSPDLEARLREYDAVHHDLVVDLSQLSFVDASGLRVLVAARRGAAQRGQCFSVTRTSPSLERLLALTGSGAALGLAEPAA